MKAKSKKVLSRPEEARGKGSKKSKASAPTKKAKSSQEKLDSLAPQVLGLRRSFGFGDRLGIATSGHLAAAARFSFAPVFAQQSIREMTRTNRSPREVIHAARTALAEAGFHGPWGADADHLKSPEDVRRTAEAGFTMFTIDPSDHIVNAADRLPPEALKLYVQSMVQEGMLESDWAQGYLGQTYSLPGGLDLEFDESTLDRIAVKYGRAVRHCAVMAEAIASACDPDPFEIEMSIDETDSITTPLDHLFVGLELRRRGVKIVSLAPRFVGDFEKGIDYRGNLEAFEAQLAEHVAVAQFCGPYKMSIHSGSDKFAVYPIIGRLCGELLHVKTAGTSYLEALRAVLRLDPDLFQQIALFSHGRFDTDRATYHLSTSTEEVVALLKADPAARERVYLDERPGRQLLHVTFGSVITLGKTRKGQPFRDALLEALGREPKLYRDLLENHMAKHLSLLSGES